MPAVGTPLPESARALPDLGARRTASAAHHQRFLENVLVKIGVHFRLEPETCELVVYLALINIHVQFRLDVGTSEVIMLKQRRSNALDINPPSLNQHLRQQLLVFEKLALVNSAR